MDLLHNSLFSLLTVLILSSICSAVPDCRNVVCPPPLVCSFPKSPIKLTNPAVCCPKTVCVCEGTISRSSSDSDSARQLETLKKRYTNCTLVEGNLELTNLKTDFIDFTKHIEQVTGYVLISRVFANYVDLSSLQLIRGITKYMESNVISHCKNKQIASNQTYEKFSLYVEFCDDYEHKSTDYLKELLMPNLIEISAGDVKFTQNSICNMNKILWKEEIFQSPSQKFFDNNYHNRTCHSCTQCPPVEINSTYTMPHGPCWGANSIDKCQIITKSICPYCGVDRCNKNRACCSEMCAGGCYNTRSNKDKNKYCHACSNMNNNGQCVQTCPDGTKMLPDSKEIVKEDKTFQFARYCVKKCPENVPETSRYCKRFCEAGTYDYGNNKCTPCKKENCSDICYGLGVNHGQLKDHKWIDNSNIKYFNKNCTIIEGSLLFIKLSFKEDTYCKVKPVQLEEVQERFQNVREITGYLSIEYWLYKDLCLFKNLQKIRGKELKDQRYALTVYTSSMKLTQLCLNSLTQIDNGVVHIYNNPRLCYANTVDWSLILHSKENYTVEKNQKDDFCMGCNLNCKKGCWGPDATQCQTCLDYTDYTNSDGKFTSKWVVENSTGDIMPGYNVTTCVRKCNYTKGVYPTEDMRCYPCHPQCLKTCNGPTAYNCTKCKNYDLDGQCVQDCPSKTHFVGKNNTCQPCSPSCLNEGCKGPEDAYGSLGCSKCHKSVDPKTLIVTLHGVQCRICTQRADLADCDQGCTSYDLVSDFKCYVPPGADYTVYIVLGSLLLFFVVMVAMVVFYCHRKDLKRIRKTIGETMVGERVLVENEQTPLTPSGAEPNQAHLRIVKESELTMGKLLGSGAFGEVYKAVWVPNIQGERVKIAVAVKTLKTPEDMMASANNEIMDEAYVMATVDCIYLVRLLGVCMTTHVSLITQLMPLGSLLEYVRDPANQEAIHAGQMLTWCNQIAKGMCYLQDKHLVHRDLAARNILVKTPNHVKITDFGLAKLLSAKEDIYQAEGGKLPIKWLAIECITERTFSYLSDVWAFGVTVWELLTLGARPYDGIRAVDMLSLLERGERLPQPPSATIDIYMILIKCWMVDRACRPSFQELVKEFTNMAKDPTRYVVLENESGNFILSPSPTDEMNFFRSILEKEQLVEDGESIYADEPDNILLQNRAPEYENQPSISARQQQNSETSFIEGPRGKRLFSRNTPSAVFSPSLSSSNNGMTRIPEGEELHTPPADQDDVFSESAQSKSNGGEPSVARKDSEETQRYTEDPTTRRHQCPSHAPPPTHPLQPTPGGSVLANESYVEGNSLVRKPDQTGSGYEPLSSFRATPADSDYVNATEGESLTPTWFENAEYMATDSGIGEDTQSLLSRGNTGTRVNRKASEHSSLGENEEAAPAFKKNPTQRPKKDESYQTLAGSSSDEDPVTKPYKAAIENPEYMGLIQRNGKAPSLHTKI